MRKFTYSGRINGAMAQVTFRYYGISPWEIEVMYGYFTARFDVKQDEIEQDEAEFVSKITLYLPVAFSEEFFRWFEYRRWERVKALFKEMKRRRGSGNAIKVDLVFAGKPTITFSIDAEDKQWFDNSVEKMDFVLELLPYHLDPAKLPAGTGQVSYRFDPDAVRWRLHMAVSGESVYTFGGGGWQLADVG